MFVGKLDDVVLDADHMEEASAVVLELNERLDVDPDGTLTLWSRWLSAVRLPKHYVVCTRLFLLNLWSPLEPRATIPLSAEDAPRYEIAVTRASGRSNVADPSADSTPAPTIAQEPEEGALAMDETPISAEPSAPPSTADQCRWSGTTCFVVVAGKHPCTLPQLNGCSGGVGL